MSAKNLCAALFVIVITGSVILAGCDEDSSYAQRTVVYVSRINDGSSFMCDVIDQGDSLYYTDTTVFKVEDDFIKEDRILIEFHNRPYDNITNPNYSLGDFLVTGYTVEFVRSDGGSPVPVQPFTGETSILVPANSMVEAYITLVPFASKRVDPLLSIGYSDNEIFSNAHITFVGHEVQTDREITFSAGIHVNFADPLITKNNRDSF
jgi:hypothetical protein